MPLNAFPDTQSRTHFQINRFSSGGTVITQAEVGALENVFGLAVESSLSDSNIAIEPGMQDGTEITIYTYSGGFNTIIVPPTGETIDLDPTGIEINFKGSTIIKKQGNNWVSVINGVSQAHDGSQPKLGVPGLTYDYFTIKTIQDAGLTADINLTTTTANQPIFDVAGVETITNNFSLPGTSAEQVIKVWVPVGEGQTLTSNAAKITEVDARDSNVGITVVSLSNPGNILNDKVGFNTLLTLENYDPLSQFTNQLGVNSPLLERFVVFGTNTIVSDGFFASAQNLREVYLANTNATVTDNATASGNMQELSFPTTNSSGISGQIVTNAPGLRIFDAANLSLSSSQVDDLLIALAPNTGLLAVSLDGNNSSRTTASDAAFATLDTLLGTALKVN